LINAAQRLNTITIKDASLPLSSEEYSEDFAGFPLLLLLDLFSGYDQCELDPSSRDMTAFQTPLGLLRMTALPQGYINAVQVFDRVMKKILKDQIAAGIGKAFIDDVAVKPVSRSMFLDKDGIPEEVAPGIRKYMLEAIILQSKILADIERACGTISGKKSEFLKEQIKIVAYVCRIDRRTPEEAKIKKITGWPAFTDLTDVRVFLETCVYYRIWTKDFSTIAEPLFKLGREKEQFI